MFTAELKAQNLQDPLAQTNISGLLGHTSSTVPGPPFQIVRTRVAKLLFWAITGEVCFLTYKGCTRWL